MIVSDDELKQLNNEKRDLILQFDQNIIEEEMYNERIRALEKRINEKIKMLLDAEKDKLEQNQEDDDRMSEVEQPKKIGKKVQKNSNASVIEKVLRQKGVKNIDDALAKFDEIKPGNDPAKTKALIKTIIREVIKGKGRWVNYTWDKENYLLIPKE